MKESALTSSNRLGGAVISDRIVASLLEELRTDGVAGKVLSIGGKWYGELRADQIQAK